MSIYKTRSIWVMQISNQMNEMLMKTNTEMFTFAYSMNFSMWQNCGLSTLVPVCDCAYDSYASIRDQSSSGIGICMNCNASESLTAYDRNRCALYDRWNHSVSAQTNVETNIADMSYGPETQELWRLLFLSYILKAAPHWTCHASCGFAGVAWF